MMKNPLVKEVGHALSLGMPLLTPIGLAVQAPWLAPVIVFGIFPVLGLVVGEDRSLPRLSSERSDLARAYLQLLPSLYAVIWLCVLIFTAAYVGRTPLRPWSELFLTISVGIASAVAVCTAHELMHRRSPLDHLVARLMNAVCLYGHMRTEHLHHHAKVGNVQVGGTAPRGMSAYQFAVFDWAQGLKNAWSVERRRLRRESRPWWHNEVLQDYVVGAVMGVSFWLCFGAKGLILFFGQAAFAVLVFEVITYVHHYGLVVKDGEIPGPRHSWAHHCWITNCLTFNNTYHSDHHARPRTPYYQLHAMYGVPRLPASYFTMFCVALVPPLWFKLMNARLDSIAQGRSDGSEEMDQLYLQRCR